MSRSSDASCTRSSPSRTSRSSEPRLNASRAVLPGQTRTSSAGRSKGPPRASARGQGRPRRLASRPSAPPRPGKSASSSASEQKAAPIRTASPPNPTSPAVATINGSSTLSMACHPTSGVGPRRKGFVKRAGGHRPKRGRHVGARRARRATGESRARARVLGPGQALEPLDHARQRADRRTQAAARPAHPMCRLRMLLARSLSARQTRRPHAAARARPEAPDRRSPRLTPSARGTLGGPAPGREQSGDVVIPASQKGTRKPRALDCRCAAPSSRFRPGEHDSDRRHRQEHEPCRHQYDHCCLSVVSIYIPYMPAGRVDRFPRG